MNRYQLVEMAKHAKPDAKIPAVKAGRLIILQGFEKAITTQIDKFIDDPTPETIEILRLLLAAKKYDKTPRH